MVKFAVISSVVLMAILVHIINAAPIFEEEEQQPPNKDMETSEVESSKVETSEEETSKVETSEEESSKVETSEVETSEEETYEYERGDDDEEDDDDDDDWEGDDSGEYSTVTIEYSSTSTFWPEVDWSSTSSTTEDNTILIGETNGNEIDDGDDDLRSSHSLSVLRNN